MSNRIPQSFIDELLARTDIIEIIDSRVTLRKMGSNYSARCPFHTEKTPSFTVSQTKQFYYCFGCGAHGNAISFLLQYERMEFLAAIETLAAKAGLEIPQDSGSKEQTQYHDLYTLLEKAAKYYQNQLRQSPAAIDYLKSRGLSGEIAKQFAIGFAPSGWENLQSYLGNNLKIREQLITAGMLVKKNQDQGYDRFRERIIFPIRDSRGRVIAFGGRTLGKETPKYLNSPETPIFHKGQELYGLYEARLANQKLEKVIIVEGYMDVVALAQHGITFAVATLGTATSSKHLQRLMRHTAEILFCFDGDTAGQQAAWRALEVTLPLMHDGIQVLFIFLPETEDPDSLIRKEGTVAFSKRMSNATPLSDFFFNHLCAQIDMNTADGKARLAKQAGDLLKKIPHGVFQQLMYDKLAKLIGINAAKLQTITEGTDTLTPATKPKTIKTARITRTQSPISLAIMLLLQHPELIACVKNNNFVSINLPGIDVLNKLLELLKQNPKLTTGALLEYWREQKIAKKLAELAVKELMMPEPGLQAEFLGALQRIEELGQEQKIQELLTKANQNQLSAEEKLQLQQLITTKSQVV